LHKPSTDQALLKTALGDAVVHRLYGMRSHVSLGNTLFVPTFFVVTGFLIDPIALARSLTEDFLPAAGIIGVPSG
jgi:hypothetical protein